MQLQFLARHARTAILAMAVIFGALLAGHGTASAASCDAYAGKQLYNCLANKLDHFASRSYGTSQAALQQASAQLRVAVNKAQALSAVSQARSVLAGLVERAKSAGQEYTGLARVAGVLAYAARLIQSKG